MGRRFVKLDVTLDILRAAQALVLVFGVVIVYFATKSYRRTKSRSMLLLAVGFALASIGSVVGGIAFELMGADLATADALQALAQALGFLIIVLSLAVAKS
jgi:hypothetical protein